jgi:pimeloyl-ACP methyl ester carboxylesterase
LLALGVWLVAALFISVPAALGRLVDAEGCRVAEGQSRLDSAHRPYACGYGSNLDKPPDELERARLDAQRALAKLSSARAQRSVKAGHNLHLEAPDIVVQAIREIVHAVRR